MLLPVLLVSGLALAGCRTPGNPPSHPGQGAYQDIIRRELEATGSALGTSVLTLRYIDDGRVPRNYGRVMVRQAANDLRKVSQDLGQITPPAKAAAAQTRLRAITDHARRQLSGLDLGDPSARRSVRAALARDSDAVDGTLTPVLDPS